MNSGGRAVYEINGTKMWVTNGLLSSLVFVLVRTDPNAQPKHRGLTCFIAEKEPGNAKPRIELGNLYFDAERYDDAIMWYEQAVKLVPNDANLSTDPGVCYYYTNQPDKALARFDASLKIDPKHLKTLLNLGIVRAFGKQDLAGATKAWEQVIAIDPNSPEGQAAKRALETLKSAHSGTGEPKPGA